MSLQKAMAEQAQRQADWSEFVNRRHPILTHLEMKEILHHRAKLEGKTLDEQKNLVYEWTKTSHIDRRTHDLLVKFVYFQEAA